jgi:methyl-accepting chemotaxis protein
MALHSAILADPEANGAADFWLGGLLRPQLAELAANMDAGFLRGGSLLGEAIETIKGLMAGLDSMNHALDETAAERALGQLRGVASELEQLPELLAGRDQALQAVGSVIGALHRHVEDLQRHLKIIGIYGMNIKIAGAGGDFRIFVDEMGGRLQAGEGEIIIFSQRLREVLASIAPVRKAYGEVRGAMTGSSLKMHQQIRECAEQLARHLEQSGALAGQLGLLAGQVQASVGRVLGAIQVADSTRQRIEHVVAIFDIFDEEERSAPVPKGARETIARLTGRLIAGAQQEHFAQTHVLGAALAELGVASSDLARLVGRGGADKGGNPLQALDEGIAAIEHMTLRLAETTTHAQTMVSGIADAADDLAARLDGIDQIVRDVKHIAINTRLLCQREGGSSAAVAVAVIAIQVATQAIRLKESAGEIAAAIRDLAHLNHGLREDGGGGKADLGLMLQEAHSVISAACRSSELALSGSGHAVMQLMGQIGDASDCVSHGDGLLRDLEGVMSALAGERPALAAEDEIWLQRVLPRAAALYTMASERQLHAEYAVGGQSAGAVDAPASAAPAVEQDDDGLF